MHAAHTLALFPSTRACAMLGAIGLTRRRQGERLSVAKVAEKDGRAATLSSIGALKAAVTRLFSYMPAWSDTSREGWNGQRGCGRPDGPEQKEMSRPKKTRTGAFKNSNFLRPSAPLSRMRRRASQALVGQAQTKPRHLAQRVSTGLHRARAMLVARDPKDGSI